MSKITVRRSLRIQPKRPLPTSDEAVASALTLVPRIAKLMALAIRFEELIRDGLVTNQAELARLGLVSRARLTQIMDLLNLAPQIQLDLLSLSEDGRSNITERALRPLCRTARWDRQIQMWRGPTHSGHDYHG